MRCLRSHIPGHGCRMASNGIFPADALPQMWQPPHHAKIPALFYGERSIQEDLGRDGEITKKQTIIIMSTELGKWDKVMSVALSVPGVKVNRNEFLVAALNNLCSVEQLKQIRQFTLSGQCSCPYDSGIGLTSSKVLTAMRGCAMETVGAAQRSRA